MLHLFFNAKYKELTRAEGNWIIAAIVVGGLIALGVIIGIIVVVIRRCRRRRNAADNTNKNLQNRIDA
ncbi:hypothetical protein PS2_020370 [Malus domestica]